MARAIAKWVVLFAAVAMVADAQSAIACGVSPCENHGSRSQPADASGPTCPHSSTPSQPADDDHSCSHGKKTVKDGLLPAKSFYAAAYADHPLGVQLPSTRFLAPHCFTPQTPSCSESPPVKVVPSTVLRI